MKVVVTTPEQFMGDVIGDINRRRGKIMNQTTQKKRRARRIGSSFKRDVWILDTAALFKLWPCDLCDGASHFERVPQKIQDEITKK